jgi:hypothetical protein
MVDVDRLFHEVSSALALAKVRADSADGSRHGELLADKLQRLYIFSSADECEVALNVDAGRTGQLAGGHAITVVLPQEELDEELPRLSNIRGVGGDHHAVSDWSAAGRDKFRFTLYSDNTNPTTLQGSKNFTVTERWDGDAILPGREENGGPRLSLNLSPVNRQPNSFRHEWFFLFRLGPKGWT